MCHNVINQVNVCLVNRSPSVTVEAVAAFSSKGALLYLKELHFYTGSSHKTPRVQNILNSFIIFPLKYS